MELKEFLEIFKKYSITFWLVLAAVFLFGFGWCNYQSKLYSVSLSIDVTREGQAQNDNYQYDQFYRLQADEKFGKNIVNWISDPIFIEANKNDFKSTKLGSWENILKIKATQLSSNYIKVEYKSKEPKSAILFGKILKKNLEQKNQTLQVDNNQDWFKLIVSDPQVVRNNVNSLFLTFILAVFGILFGILGVLLRHYFNFEEDENRN